MSKDEMMQETIEIAAHNMDWFIGIVGVLVTIFALFQWYYSDKQLEKVKNDIRHEYDKKLELLNKKLLDQTQIKATEGQVIVKCPRTFNSHIRKFEGSGIVLIDLEIGFSWSYKDGMDRIPDFVKTSINDYYLSGEFQILSTDNKASASLIQDVRTGDWILNWNSLPESNGLYSFDFHHIWINPTIIVNRRE